MPSIFGHVIAASFFTKVFQLVNRRKNLLFWAGFCAFFPDLDVIGFQFGISYQSQWGHRGFTHSLFFCTIFGLFIAWGMRVLLSELLWIGLPCWLVYIGVKAIRLLYADSKS